MTQAKQTTKLIYQSRSLDDTEKIGRDIAANLHAPACVHFEGGLGAGKTTLCKSIINSLGYTGNVTSPTYNLIQEYQLNNGMVYHMDLYRLQSPEELEFLAVSDLWNPNSLFLIEWPERGRLFLPDATHKIVLNEMQQSASSREIVFLSN